MAEAFQNFRRDVEVRLEGLLRGVPGVGGSGGDIGGGVSGGGGRGSRGDFGGGVRLREEGVGDVLAPPPAYGDVKRG